MVIDTDNKASNIVNTRLGTGKKQITKISIYYHNKIINAIMYNARSIIQTDQYSKPINK